MAKQTKKQVKFNQFVNSWRNAQMQALGIAGSAASEVFLSLWGQQVRQRCFIQLLRCSEKMRARIMREIGRDVIIEMRNQLIGLALNFGKVV